ncbi:MAG: DUF6515 family protein [Dissulfuribacterales bacterium]
MKTIFRYSLIVFILISLSFYTPVLYAWDRGVIQGNHGQNTVSSEKGPTDDDEQKTDMVRKGHSTNTPVYNVETAKPLHSPAIEQQPVPPVTINRPVQQERHFRPADVTQPQPREDFSGNRPGLLERTPHPDRNAFQPQPSIADRDMKDHRPDRPNISSNNPFDANRNDNTLIKPAFEPRDRHIQERREIRYHENIRDDRGIDRTPLHRPPNRPIVGERIYPTRGMSFYRELPAGHNRVFVRNQLYFNHEGRFYKKMRDGFIWFVPPPGIVVTTLPFGCTSFMWEGVEYYTYAGIYYRPTYGGYVVVEEPDDLPSPWEMDAPPFDFVIVNTELLNVRSGPSEDFPVVEQAMYGERLQVLGTYQDWYYIRLPNGRKGWIMAYYTYPEGSG